MSRIPVGLRTWCMYVWGAACAEDASLTPEQTAFFEQKIRPVLAENCYQCHSAEAQTNKKLKGGLFLDTRAGLLTGGDTGQKCLLGPYAH